MSCFVQICDEEGEEPMEMPLEDDGSLLLSTLTAQFPGACGLKYRHPESRSLRGVRLIDERFMAPEEGWDYVFICNFPKENKRKIDDHMETSINKKRMEGQKCVDLIVLGLPWKTTEDELKQYFEQYGDLLMAQVKKDKNGQSKGFGFIRYETYESQRRALLQRHVIDGRVCDVRIPNSKEGMFPVLNSKVFIGRCTEDITVEDLREHFSKYGEVTDVFIPKPFRAFAFVTFLDPEVASMLCGEDHIIKGNSVYITNAAPRSERGGGRDNNFSGGNDYRGGRGEGYGGDRYERNSHHNNSHHHGGSGGSGGGYNNGAPANWNNGGGNGGWNNRDGGQNNGSNVPDMDWKQQMGGMNPLAAMPMLAALSQASMGLLGSMQGGPPPHGGDNNHGGGHGHGGHSGGHGGHYQDNQGGRGGGNWNNQYQGGGRDGGNRGGSGRRDRYNR